MPHRSILWDYFTRVHKDLAFCNTCDREISVKGSNTSNLASHLRHNHFSDYQQMQERKQDNKDPSTNDEYSKFSNDDSSDNGEPTENGKYSQDPLVMVPPTSSRSEMAEVSSLLSLAMPMANVNFLVDEGGGPDEAVAIEVRPRERLFRVRLKI